MDALLAVNPLDRPRASDARKSFIEACQLFEPFSLRPSEDPISLSDLNDEEAVYDYTNFDLQSPDYDYLSTLYRNREDKDAAYEIWKALLISQGKVASLGALLRDFVEGHLWHEQFDGAIAAATELVRVQPTIHLNYVLLMKAYRAKGDADLAIAGLKKLANQCEPGLLQQALVETYQWRTEEGGGPIETWEIMLSLLPTDPKVHFRLVSACKVEGNIDNTIANWEGLVRRHPYNLWLQQRLAGAYDRTGNPDVAVVGWAKLVMDYPNEPTFPKYLEQAREWRSQQ